ncbi:hypothetical protein Grass_214 [Bacillus phage Grass]|uniref:Uncharacterized protein n=1 Tax=Bacillus phage Grass TaxID=1406785 RepID=U5PU96_BPGRA|nr:hypothetical protein Grass_214 [Bacillus phage Grass]AGY47479.1 hypothetical protein Grass_214 [Bacillus phage Grass]
MRAFRVTYNVGGSSGKQAVLLGNFPYDHPEGDLLFFLSKKDPEFDPNSPFCKITRQKELSMDQVRITDLSARELRILLGV